MVVVSDFVDWSLRMKRDQSGKGVVGIDVVGSCNWKSYLEVTRPLAVYKAGGPSITITIAAQLRKERRN
jgi:hypothetical protein